MASVEDFANGANILQQVDVSQIFKSLAMGIAEAQQELDDNSISQLQRLSETELAGKSLLELGFVPAFYAFTYADISASIHLRMAEKTSFELGASASFDFNSANASEGDFSNLSKESEFNSEKGEFKSNRRFSMKSSSTSRIKVNNQYYNLDQQEGCVSKIEKMHDQLLQDEKIERVNIQKSKAYTTVYKPLGNFKFLIITNPSGTVTVGSASPFTIDVDFSVTFTAAATTTPLYGFSGSKMYGLIPSPTEMEFFFDFDKRVMDFGYDKTYTSIDDKDKAFEVLATILRLDPSLTITVEGYTDSRADAKYNAGLSLDRCNAMRDWLVSKGADPNQITVAPKGESLALSNSGPDETKNPLFRKVKIVLPAGRSYIYYSSMPSISVTVAANIIVAAPTGMPFVVINGNAPGFITTGMTLSSTLNDYESANTTAFHSEQREDTLYLLDKETEITYMTYSSESENIEIVAEEGSQEEIKVYQNENSQERIKNLATKNKSNKTFAASAAVDIRISRQFEMSLEGSASMSARMVAVPPPDEFKTHIATIFNNEE